MLKCHMPVQAFSCLKYGITCSMFDIIVNVYTVCRFYIFVARTVCTNSKLHFIITSW